MMGRREDSIGKDLQREKEPYRVEAMGERLADKLGRRR
jgi:hypothetical protein